MSDAETRTLVLAREPPVPARSGLRLRILHLARELARTSSVDLAFWKVADYDADGEPFKLIGLPLGWGVPRLGWARTLWRPRELGIPRGRPLEEFAARAHWDTVLAHELPLVGAAKRAGAPAILDTHNVYADVLRTLSAADSRPLQRLNWRYEWLKTRRYEARIVRSLDAVTAASDDEAARFEELGARNCVVVPNGVDVSAIPHRPPAEGAQLLYIGHYGWRPNVEAAMELCDEILPRVRAEVPSAHLRLIGGLPPNEDGPTAPELVDRAGPDVEVTGEVPEVLPHLRESRALVVPLRAGGGTRLKVLEALAAGVPVVSTPFGAVGLGLDEGRHVLTGETPAELAAQVLRVIRDDDLARHLSIEGRALVERAFDWPVVAAPLVELNERLGRSRALAAA